MKNKKVLFTATVDSHILHFHIPYLKWFHEKGYEVHVATNGEENIPFCDVKHKVSFARSPFKIDNIKAIRELKKIIEQEKFEIIHCHTPMGSVVTRIAAKKARKTYGTKVIYTAHGFHFFKGAPVINWLLFYPIEKWLSTVTDCLITINEEDYAVAKRRFHANKTYLVYGVGVDTDKFSIEMTEAEEENLRRQLGLNKEEFIMIYVAELNKNKNQIMIIEAMRKIVEKNNKIKMLLVGKGELSLYYKEIIKKYQLEDNIFLLGYRKDIPQLLKIAHLYIATSKREGLPVNIVESLLAKVPVIATNTRGHRELVKQGENGYLVEIDDEQELKQKIEDIIENYANRQYRFDVNRYCIENVIKQMIEIYKEVENEKKEK